MNIHSNVRKNSVECCDLPLIILYDLLPPHLHSPHGPWAQANIPQKTRGPFTTLCTCCSSCAKCLPSPVSSHKLLFKNCFPSKGASSLLPAQDSVFRTSTLLSRPISTFHILMFFFCFMFFFFLTWLFSSLKEKLFKTEKPWLDIFESQTLKLGLAPDRYLLNVCYLKKKGVGWREWPF